MPRSSAGILLFRFSAGTLEVFLVHYGGPQWMRRDLGAWTIPKGEFADGEDALAAARREFAEETGFELTGDFIPLAPVKQKAGKVVHAWAVEGNVDPAQLRSNTFSIEWPPKSGTTREFPEVDRAAWFSMPEAMEKINSAQRALLQQLETRGA
jgi:predicted NUDIX family NTP pyrophosphohydrolase